MRAVAGLVILLLSAILSGCVGVDDTPVADVPDLAVDDLAAEGLARLLPARSFEPTVAVSSSGTIFMSVFAGGTGPSHETLYRSRDQGLTWEDVTPTWADTGLAKFPGNSNDPFIYIDPVTDRLFNFEMQGLSCNTMAYSDDEGDSWTTVPLGCTPTQGIQDHQSLFTSKPRTVATVGYENVVHYCINRVADTACAFSLDGGITWGPMRALVYNGLAPQDCGIAGGLAAHGTSAPDGTIYLPRGYCGVPTVAISEDDGLTWTIHTISETDDMIGHEVRVAVDEAGTAYAAWIGTDRRVKFAQSEDGGRTWGETLDITPEGVTITDFPAIAAGAEGRVAVSFIGSDTNATNDEGEPVGYSQVPWHANWSAWLVTGTGLSGDNETVWRSTTANAADDPIARGVCGGSRCQGIGDFLDVDIDASGRPWAAFVDVCHEECRNVTEEPAEECSAIPVIGGCSRAPVNDYALGMVGTLATGPALRGDLVALPQLSDAAAKQDA